MEADAIAGQEDEGVEFRVELVRSDVGDRGDHLILFLNQIDSVKFLR